MIVVISHPSDPHAQQVCARLADAGRPHLLLDWSDFPEQGRVSAEVFDTDTTPRLDLHHDRLGTVDLTDCRSVWWRRPQAPHPEAVVDPSVVSFAHSEWSEMINGLQVLLPARWMNHPVADAAASRKLLQLRMARAAGLSIPETLATTNPDDARQFVDRCGVGKTVSKTFLATHQVWRPTAIVGPEAFEQLDQVRVCPVIFQRYVEGVDLRVTVVGKRVFAAEIDARATSSPEDFRLVLGESKVRPVELPADVERRVLLLHERLGLEYGAADLRRTPDGEHVFLEINTAGEFLFVEQLTGLPITQAVADHLALVPQVGSSDVRRG